MPGWFASYAPDFSKSAPDNVCAVQWSAPAYLLKDPFFSHGTLLPALSDGPPSLLSVPMPLWHLRKYFPQSHLRSDEVLWQFHSSWPAFDSSSKYLSLSHTNLQTKSPQTTQCMSSPQIPAKSPVLYGSTDVKSSRSVHMPHPRSKKTKDTHIHSDSVAWKNNPTTYYETVYPK